MSVNLSEALLLAARHWIDIKAGTLSLDKAIARCAANSDTQMRAAIQSILLTTVRHRAKSELIVTRLVKQAPIEAVSALLDVALAQLISKPTTSFTVVNQAVCAAKLNTETAFASGFINAVLRNFLRNRDPLEAIANKNLSARFNAPGWWISKVRKSYPSQWESILSVQTKHPPLTLRVNRRKTTTEDYLKGLKSEKISARQVGPWAVIIEPPRPVHKIPGFADGLVSVQDAGSQLVADFLPLKDGDRVLDACAAPGGKTAQLLETYDAEMTALEIDPIRAPRIQETLDRLGLKATTVVGSAADVTLLKSLGAFDAVMLDAPCTASGIVRRHPDIPWSRRPEDIAKLAATQAEILDAVWEALPPGKVLLYSVCSIFPEEGPEQIASFLKRHTDAILAPLGNTGEVMLRLLPTENEKIPLIPLVHDGFFYALLIKKDV